MSGTAYLHTVDSPAIGVLTAWSPVVDIACLENCVVDFHISDCYILKCTRETYTVPRGEHCPPRLTFTLLIHPQSVCSLPGLQWLVLHAMKIAL